MKVLNMWGGPSTGKSTTAAGLYNLMKKNHMSVELVGEYAKLLIYSGMEGWLTERQEHIFTTQLHMLKRLENHADWAIADSPLLLSSIYAKDDMVGVKHFKQYVLENYNQFDNINIFLRRPDVFEESGRVHNLEEAMEVDNVINQMFIANDIPYYVFDANETVEQDIFNLIMEDIINT